MSRRSNALTAKSSKMECFPRRVVARIKKAHRRAASAKLPPSGANSAAPANPANQTRYTNFIYQEFYEEAPLL